MAMGYIIINIKRKTNIQWEKYPHIRKSSEKSPLIISNHTTLCDILYTCYKYSPSFISSNHVSNMPIIGKIGQTLECVFLDRNDSKSREAALNKIVEKVSSIQKSTRSSPLVIFPEGITGKGGVIKTFRRGAFYSLSPVTPLFMKYHAIAYESAYYFFELLDDMVLTLSEPFQMLTVYQLPNIEPNTKSSEEYCSDVYNLYKTEFNLIPKEINLKERDKFIEEMAYQWRN